MIRIDSPQHISLWFLLVHRNISLLFMVKAAAAASSSSAALVAPKKLLSRMATETCEVRRSQRNFHPGVKADGLPISVIDPPKPTLSLVWDVQNVDKKCNFKIVRISVWINKYLHCWSAEIPLFLGAISTSPSRAAGWIKRLYNVLLRCVNFQISQSHHIHTLLHLRLGRAE